MDRKKILKLMLACLLCASVVVLAGLVIQALT